MKNEITRYLQKDSYHSKSLAQAAWIRTGTRLAMFTDGENILLKPIPTPDVSAFRKMADEARKVADKAKT